jgi:hypothetical protein
MTYKLSYINIRFQTLGPGVVQPETNMASFRVNGEACERLRSNLKVESLRARPILVGRLTNVHFCY